MVGIIRRAYASVGAVGGAFGIAGWQDDARIWAKWAEMNPELAGALMGAGGIMVATWLVWEIAAFRARKQRKVAPAIGSDERGAVIVHGGIHVRNVYFNSRDGKHHAEIEGKGEIVSPAPVLLETHLRAIGGGSATLKRPPAASDDERPE